jgi:hypothetical protein
MLSSIIKKKSLNEYIPEDKIIKNGYCFDCNSEIKEIYKRCYHCNLFYKNFYKQH